MFNYDLTPLYKETYTDAAVDRFNAAVTEAMELVTHFGLRKNNFISLGFLTKYYFTLQRKNLFMDDLRHLRLSTFTVNSLSTVNL
jgi:hypothetical protein